MPYQYSLFFTCSYSRIFILIYFFLWSNLKCALSKPVLEASVLTSGLAHVRLVRLLVLHIAAHPGLAFLCLGISKVNSALMSNISCPSLSTVLRIRIQDPGSGTFLPPGSGIRNRFFPDPGCRIPPLLLRA